MDETSNLQSTPIESTNKSTEKESVISPETPQPPRPLPTPSSAGAVTFRGFLTHYKLIATILAAIAGVVVAIVGTLGFLDSRYVVRTADPKQRIITALELEPDLVQAGQLQCLIASACMSLASLEQLWYQGCNMQLVGPGKARSAPPEFEAQYMKLKVRIEELRQGVSANVDLLNALESKHGATATPAPTWDALPPMILQSQPVWIGEKDERRFPTPELIRESAFQFPPQQR